MDQERWQRVRSLAEQAWSLATVEQRAVHLDRECGDDPALRREVEALLAADEDSEGFLGSLAVRSGLGRDDDVPDLSGRQVGAYRLIEPLGRGGMGVVYLGERADGEYEHQVAVKLLPMGMTTPDARARFVAERQILAGLEHPAIARLLDGGVSEDGTPYFVLELVDGERIDHYCDRHRLSIEQRLLLMIQVCEAVEAAHRQLVVHRDLKPANVLVTEGGQPKLLDFGVAKVLSATGPGVTQSRGAPLTPAWAAPEQVSGGAVTTATDTHALGGLVYLLLTGVAPYGLDDTSPTALAERLAIDAPPPSRRFTALSPEEQAKIAAARDTTPFGLARTLTGDLDAVVSKALAPEPDRRYGAAVDLSDDLRAHLESRPVAARPPSRRYRMARFAARHRLGVAAAVLVVAVGLAGIAATLWQADQAREQAQQAKIQAARAEQQALQATTALMRAAAVREFLLGAYGAYVSPVGESRWYAIDELLDVTAARADGTQMRKDDLRAELLITLARLEMMRGDRESALRHLRESVALTTSRRFEIPEQAAYSLLELGLLERRLGNYNGARPHFEQVLELHRQSDSVAFETALQAAINIVRIRLQSGDAENALRMIREWNARVENRSHLPGLMRFLTLETLGDALLANHLTTEAIDAWRRASRVEGATPGQRAQTLERLAELQETAHNSPPHDPSEP